MVFTTSYIASYIQVIYKLYRSADSSPPSLSAAAGSPPPAAVVCRLIAVKARLPSTSPVAATARRTATAAARLASLPVRNIVHPMVITVDVWFRSHFLPSNLPASASRHILCKQPMTYLRRLTRKMSAPWYDARVPHLGPKQHALVLRPGE